MGTLYYGSHIQLQVEDRELSHLKIVATAKLRRGEGFLLSWIETVDTGSGRGSLWIHEMADLYYRFDGGKAPELDRELLDEMMVATVGSTGLHITASMRKAPGR